MTLAPRHLDGHGIQRRELHHDLKSRTPAYRAGWRYDGKHRAIMGGRAWWAPS